MKYDHKFNPWITIIAGTILTGIITGIKYITNQPSQGFISLALVFILGALTGHMLFSKHHSIIKDVVVLATLTFIAWTYLNPIQKAGETIIIQKTEFTALILIVLIFIDFELKLKFTQAIKRQPKIAFGFIGGIILMILMGTLGILDIIGKFIGENIWLLLLISLPAIAYIYVRANKLIDKLTGKATKTLAKMR